MAMQQLTPNDALDPLERKFVTLYSLASFARRMQQFVGTAIAVALFAIVVDLLLELTGLYPPSLVRLSDLNGYDFLGFVVGATWYAFLLLVALAFLRGIHRGSFLAGLLWFVAGYYYLRFSIQLWTFFLAHWGGGALVAFAPGVARDLAIGYAALIVFVGLAHLLTIDFAMWRGGFAAITAGNAERAIFRETPSGARFPRNAVSAVWGLPPLTQFARRPRGRYAAIIGLSILGNLFLSGASLAVLAAPVAVPFVMVYLLFALRLQGLLVDVVASVLSIGFVVAVIFTLSWIGRFIESAVIRLVRLSLEKLQEVDHRQPILFLRAFRDDQVDMDRGRIPYFVRVLEFGRRKPNLDQMLLEEATPYGPLVGLGSPRDKTPPYGAARGYFEDKDWKQAVESLVRESSVTILCLDETEGVWWEVEHLAATKEVQKTLFLVHPGHRTPAANQQLLGKLIDRLELDSARAEQLLAPLPDPSAGRDQATVLGFFVDGDGQLRVLRSSTFSRFAFLLALHVFMRAKLGMPQMAGGKFALPVATSAPAPVAVG
jgi:hypothetical protein